MTTFNYPGHQRHIKKKIEARLEIARKEVIEQWNLEQQMLALDIAVKKVRGEKLTDDEHDFLYHPSFDDYAECMLWHMPPEKFDDMIEQLTQLYSREPKQMWSHWIHPRVAAVKQMKLGYSGLISGHASNVNLYWDKQIRCKYASDYGRDNHGWYEVSLIPEQQEGPIMESERAQQPKPPVVTPPPVAKPWWFKFFNFLRR